VTREDVKDLQPTCNQLANDCISRQAAIDAIGEKSDEIYKTKQKGATYPHDDFFQGRAYAENVVKQLPPVQPEKRTETHARDCISRQAAIRIASGYCHPANIAAELAKLPPVQPEQRWIPVSERLPEEDYRYGDGQQCSAYILMSAYNAEDRRTVVDCGHAIGGNWYSDTECQFVPSGWEVIAWMPLPEGYSGE
jgi:hypothetical protein